MRYKKTEVDEVKNGNTEISLLSYKLFIISKFSQTTYNEYKIYQNNRIVTGLYKLTDVLMIFRIYIFIASSMQSILVG